MLLNTGRELVQSRHGLLSTLAYQVGPACRGSVCSGCNLIVWRMCSGQSRTVLQAQWVAPQNAPAPSLRTAALPCPALPACLQLGPTAAPHYALEGSIAIAGQGISWLRDRMGFIGSAGAGRAAQLLRWSSVRIC